ncbi:MAG TPA: hypothetical protein VN085_09835, partial [Vicinamibacterales bacterium]|nr:hypothetical protein [Vicinamibacterales bacterium]
MAFAVADGNEDVQERGPEGQLPFDLALVHVTSAVIPNSDIDRKTLQRTGEIGIRMALGATRASIMRFVFGAAARIG